MTPVLIIEIVSALIACVAAVIMLVQFIVSKLRGRNRRRPKGHTVLPLILIITAIVHGVAAMLYGSGASIIAYVFGWIGLLCFVASGVTMLSFNRPKLENACTRHVALFLLGIVFIVAHAIAGRM